jgi:hypothetical protein
MSAYAPQRLHIVPQTGHNDFSMGTVRYQLQKTHSGHPLFPKSDVHAKLSLLALLTKLLHPSNLPN